MRCLFKLNWEKVWRGTPWSKLPQYCCRGLGGLSPRSALQLLRLQLGRRSGLRPLQGSKQASSLQRAKKDFLSDEHLDFKDFVRSDLNQAVPNHGANVNNRQTHYPDTPLDLSPSLTLSFSSSSYYHSFSKQKQKKRTSNMNVFTFFLRFSFHDHSVDRYRVVDRYNGPLYGKIKVLKSFKIIFRADGRLNDILLNFVSTLLWYCWKRGSELSTLCCTLEFNKMS